LETLYFKDGRAAFEKQFDAIRAYARYGSPSSLFVPFAWARGPWPNAEVRKLSLEWKKHKEHNRILAHLAVPGAAYSVSLHRLDETWALETVSFNLGYRIVANPGSLDAEPIRLKFQWGDDKHEEPSEKSGRLQAVDSK